MTAVNTVNNPRSSDWTASVLYAAQGAPLAATAADTAETDLAAFELPVLTNPDEVAQGYRIEAAGVFAGNVNDKRVRLYFGETVVADTGAVAADGTAFFLTADIHGVASGESPEQVAFGRVMHGTTVGASVALPAAAWGDAETPIAVKVTGLNGTASAADITLRLFRVAQL